MSTFNLGSNSRQASLLSQINPNSVNAQIAVHRLDDTSARHSPTRLTLPTGQARLISAKTLADHGAALDGALGDGTGK